MRKKLMLVDANSLIHRAFHALPPFKTSEGELVNAVYGFCSIMLTILAKLEPDYVAVSFDVSKKTFRHKEYEGYKAKRVKAPDELYAQFGRIKEILSILHIPIFEKEGFEADDVIATVNEHLKSENDVDVLIITSDKDALQLVGDKTCVISPNKGGRDNITYDKAKVIEKFGLRPDQIIDFKALTGDPSDNIPGVAGIGNKTATTLLQKYETLDGVYEHLDEITGAVHNKLKNGKEEAYFSQKLVTLVHDTPIDFNLEDTKYHHGDFKKVLPLFQKLQFRSLIGRIKKMMPLKEENPAQTSLF